MVNVDVSIQANSEHAFLSSARIKTITVLAGPILAAMLTMNLMGLIDTGMIGQLGDVGLAAVSVGGNLFFLVFSLVMGMSAGVQVLVARRAGAGDQASALAILNAALLFTLIISVVVTSLSYGLLPLLAPAINGDPLVVQNANAYLFAVLPSLITGGLASAFGGYWIGLHRPMINLLVIAVQLLCNAFFNYLLIFGNWGLPRLEVMGAGLGTALANTVALLLNIVIMLWLSDRKQFLRVLPSKEDRKTLLMFSIPMGAQQFLFALGMMVFVLIVGLLGTKTLAAFQVIMAIMMTSLMLAIGLGTTATTLVSGALGRKSIAEASQWGWEISTLGAGLLLVIGLAFFLLADKILPAFVADPSTAELALLPMRIMIISIWLEAFGRILSMALVGAGAVATAFKITFTNQWLLRLPLYWVVGVFLQQGLVGIFITMLVLYLLQTLTFMVIWQRKNWGVAALAR